MANCFLHCFSLVRGRREEGLLAGHCLRGHVSRESCFSVPASLWLFLLLLMIKSFPSFPKQTHVRPSNTCGSGERGMRSTLQNIKENKRGRVCLSSRPGADESLFSGQTEDQLALIARSLSLSPTLSDIWHLFMWNWILVGPVWQAVIHLVYFICALFLLYGSEKWTRKQAR